MPDLLDDTHAVVARRAANADVVTIGYPRFFDSAGADCRAARGFDAVEADALDDLADRLDAVVAARSDAAGFTHLSVIDAFGDHGVCADQPWLNGRELSIPDGYHPTHAGHRDAFARLVEAALGG